MRSMFGWRASLGERLFHIARLIPDAIEHIAVETPPDTTGDDKDPFDIEWVDLRGRERTAKDKRGRSKGTRAYSRVTGIALHQPAVNIREPERTLSWPVHGAVLAGPHENSARVVLLHDPTAYLYHGHGFNRRDIGIEVGARACGIEGDPRTLWLPKKHSHLEGEARLAKAVEATGGQLEGCRRLMRYYAQQVEANGGRLEYIHAHRQSHKSRVSDPGSRIWQYCGEWAKAELGLSSGPGGWSLGSGHALPDAWTGEANGVRYNWRVDGRLDR